MDWLNYHHLHYFWVVAREGSITQAAEQLHLAQPTLSNQIRKLEQSLGVKLFQRSGRNLMLTDSGQLVFRYADEIFTLGRELADAVRGRDSQFAQRFTVGIPDVLPKLVVFRLLKPALLFGERLQLVCYEGKLSDLLADLAVHRLDMVLADSPLGAGMHIRAFNHLLGECGASVFASPELAAQYRGDFPQFLDGAPMLLPTQNTSLRRGLEQWFDESGIRPETTHEFEDSALLKVMGQEGEGFFTAPAAIEKEICRQYRVQLVGRIDAVRERFYAISVERRLKHPAVVAISQAARREMFA